MVYSLEASHFVNHPLFHHARRPPQAHHPSSGLALHPGVSGIVASLLVGASAQESADVGNLVASITVQQLGTTGTASPQQVVDRWRETH
jgi:hypothetical protein